MTITVKKDDGTETIFQDVTEAYLMVRQFKPVAGKDGAVQYDRESRSYSWGANLREIVKEVHQSVIEIQEALLANPPKI